MERAVEIFTQKITSILDQLAPVKRIQLRRNYCPWISQETKKLMDQRDEVVRKCKNNNSLEKTEMKHQE